MPSTLHSTGNAEIAERRARVRALATPPIYVQLDNLNGGLVFNISEDGLALTAALDLAGDSMVAMRILLPGSDGWMQAKGEIAWRGKSRKEGGVRFIGLAENVRRRIAHWIAAEASLKESRFTREAGGGFVGVTEGGPQRAKNWSAPETLRGEFPAGKEMKQTGIPPASQKEDARQRPRNWIFQEAPREEFGPAKDDIRESEKHIIDTTSVRASKNSILETITSPLIAEQKPGVVIPADSDTRLNETNMGVAEVGPPPPLVLPDKLRGAEGVLKAAERRDHARTLITPPVYVSLQNTNGGLAFNMSEDGMALTAALTLAGAHTMSLRIQIPDSKGWMEASGRLAWRSESRKTAGITFVALPAHSRQRIREWLAAESTAHEPRPEERMLPGSSKLPSDSDYVSEETPMLPLPELLNSNAIVERRMLEAILSAGPLASRETATEVRISQPGPQRELPKQADALSERPVEHPETTENSEAETLNSEEAFSINAVQENCQAPVASHPAAAGIRLETSPATVDASEPMRWYSPKRHAFKPKSKRAFHPTTWGTRAAKFRRLAAAVTIIGATAAGIGWVAGHPTRRNEVRAFIAENTEGTSNAAKLKASRPTNKTTNNSAPRQRNSGSQARQFEPMSVHDRATKSEARSAPARPQIRDIERPPSTSTAQSAAHDAESSLPKKEPARLGERTSVAAMIPPVESARNQVAQSRAAHPLESSPTPATSPSANVGSGAALTAVKEQESPQPAPEQSAVAVPPVWSVAVSTDPYPSIRIPQDVSSQKPSSTTSLQIGRVISRVEPVYPEDAKQQGIEGTVRLHVVVDRDGSVQGVTPISGQVSLAKAAINAVREWRYAQTFLGGQPVETEQDIMVKFRAAGAATSNN